MLTSIALAIATMVASPSAPSTQPTASSRALGSVVVLCTVEPPPAPTAKAKAVCVVLSKDEGQPLAGLESELTTLPNGDVGVHSLLESWGALTVALLQPLLGQQG